MRINVSNESKLQFELDEIQKRTKTNQIGFDDIRYSIEYLEEKLNFLIPKKYWKGCCVTVDLYASKNNGSYTPQSTHFVLERGSSSWFVVGVYRCYRDTHSYRGITEHVLKYAKESVQHTIANITESTLVRVGGKYA